MTEVIAIEIELLERERQALEATPDGRRLVAVQRALAERQQDAAALSRPGSGAFGRNKPYEGLGIVAATRFLLREAGVPLTTGEIAHVLKARGVTTRSSKFVATIYSTLLNSQAFVRLGQGRAGRWALAEWNVDREAA